MKKALAGLALASALAFAQGRGMGPGPMGPGVGRGAGTDAPIDQVQSFLGLTADQVTKLRANQAALVSANQSAMEQIRQKQQALNTLMQQTAPNPTEVGTLMVDMKSLRAQVESNRDKYVAEAVKLLTPDQLTKLKQLEAAQQLAPTIGQAMHLLLLDRPEPPAGAPGLGLGRPPMGLGWRR